MSDFFKTDLEKKMDAYSGKNCEICQKPMSQRVFEYAVKFYGSLLCIPHQKGLEVHKKEHKDITPPCEFCGLDAWDMVKEDWI